MIVVISDVHLGLEECNKKSFEKFIDNVLASKDIEYLVLLGDILDFWRTFPEGVLLENVDILYKLNRLNTKKYYIIGNHDYSLCNMKSRNEPFEFTKDLVLESGGKKFRFIHGHQIEYADWLYFYEKLSLELCTSGPEMTQIQSDTWDFYQKVKSFTKQGIWRPLLQKGAVYTEKLRNLEDLSDEHLRRVAESLVTPLKERKRSGAKSKKRKEGLKPEEQLRKIAESLVTPLKERKGSLYSKNLFGKKSKDESGRLKPDEFLGKIVTSILAPPKNRKKSSPRGKELMGKERVIAQKSVGLNHDEFLVYGHTHEPFVRKDVANAGSWVSDADKQNTYLIIKDGKVNLKSR